jgi:hypothetical protein
VTTAPHPDVDQLLRSLDVAPERLTPAQQQRAVASLERIVATGPEPESQTESESESGRRSPRVRRRVRPLLVLPTAAVAVAAAALLLPRGTDTIVYASWTPAPAPLTSQELAVVAPACREQLGGGSLDLARAQLVLAERRGEFVALLYRTANPDVSGSCLARLPRGGTDVDDVRSGIGGSSGPALTPSPRGFTQGAIAQYAGASITDGAVGSDVTGVTIHADGLAVTASVSDGRYVAWWPGRAFGPRRTGAGAGPELLLSYDLTLADGTVLRDATPERPS